MGCPFDQVVDRRNTDCIKWDGVLEVFGREDVLPMWVADMDSVSYTHLTLPTKRIV